MFKLLIFWYQLITHLGVIDWKNKLELDLNHLNNNNTVKNKNTNITYQKNMNSLNELKNEFQKNIKDLIPKNAKEIIAIEKTN